MRISALFYSLKQGIKSIGKNKMFSIASIATMSACIFMFGVFYIIVANFTSSMKQMEESVAVTVFFQEDLSEEQIKVIGNQIQNDRATIIKEMRFVSAEEAWEEFKKVYFEGHEELAEAFVDDNPLEHSANYQIKLNAIEEQGPFVVYLQSVAGVREVKASKNVVDTFSDLNKMVAYVSGAIIIILLLVSIFLISNTIAVGISVRKEEIGIMKLVGASDFLVRSPYVFEGIIIGLIGSGIPLLILYLSYDQVVAYIGKQFGMMSGLIAFVGAGELFEILLPVALALGVGIGLIGSLITVRKHLNV